MKAIEKLEVMQSALTELTLYYAEGKPPRCPHDSGTAVYDLWIKYFKLCRELVRDEPNVDSSPAEEEPCDRQCALAKFLGVDVRSLIGDGGNSFRWGLTTSYVVLLRDESHRSVDEFAESGHTEYNNTGYFIYLACN